MKKIIITLILIIAISGYSVNSQWVVQNSGITGDIRSLCVIDTNNAYALSMFFVVKTTNGGIDWTTNLNLDTYFDDVSFLDANTGYIIGRTIHGSFVYKTTNAGTNWIPIGSIPALLKFSLCFLNTNTGYAAAFGGVYKTTDGGSNWDNLYNGASDFQDVYFVNETTGWGSTNIGNIMKTTNGGNNWMGYGATAGFNQHGLFFLNGNTGWIAADGGRVAKSTNAGWIPWVTYQIGMPSCELYAVCFVNDQTGWTVGCQGSIHRSSDGGLTWAQQITGTASALYDVKFANQSTGWAAGTSGRILKTTNGGILAIEPISSEVPGKYSLSQNYPNPFNPSTKIRFAVPSSGNVNLEIFDNLGREKTKLLSEELRPGIYEIEFNAVNFPSGIYFYRITTGEFTDTKKMVLIK